tara:strand:+ start:474 stop:1220 length:747 start_codon:yes stop_codon:yes gene_type:complete
MKKNTSYFLWGAAKVSSDRIEPTHYVRNFLVKRLVKRYSKKFKINNICEIGCGVGINSINLANIGFKIDAFDMDKEAVNLAKKYNKHKNIDYRSKDVLKLKSNKKYDMVLAIEVLEHIREDAKALNKISSILNKKGTLLLTVPIHEHYRREFDDRSGHVRRYKPSDLIKKLKNSGFEIIYKKFLNFPLLWIWYFTVYLPYSNKKAKESADKKLPFFVRVLGIINKFFLIDLLFNSKKATNILILARKI